MTRLALPALLAALLVAGCSPPVKTLATVGSQKVTAEDFERAALGSAGQYAGPPEVAKATLVEDLLKRAMMLEMAHRLGHENTPVAVNSRRDEERKALILALWSRLAPQAQPVSEAEARALYEARGQEAQVRLLYTSSKQGALAALERIKAGEPFASVSRTYSLPGALPPDGEMGMIAPGSLPNPLDDAVRTLPVGALGGPYQTREGWFVMQVARRVPRQQPPYEQLRADMLDLMRQRKQRAAFDRAWRDLKASWHVELLPGGSQLLFRLLSPVAPLEPTPDQRRQALATYDGGRYTVQDALDDLASADTQRPSFQLLPAVEIWIEAQTMRRVAVLEARRRHLDQEPDLVAMLRAKQDQLLLEGIYAAAMANVPAPGPDLVKLAWERVKDRFTRLTEVQLAIVVVPDSARARALADQRGRMASLAEAVKAVDPALAVTEQVVKYPSSDPAWAALLAMFTQMPPGAWYGPEPVPGGWRILQLVNKTTAQQAFEELPQPLQQSIANSAGELARDERFRQFTDSLQRALHPVIDREAIAKLEWPTAGAGGGR